MSMSAPRRPFDLRRTLCALAVLALVAFPAAALCGDGPTPAAPGPSAPAAPRAKIAFDRYAHDFGPAKQNAELKTEFTLRNEGTAPLHISEVRGDCGCAGATISANEIAAGGTAKVTAVFRTYTFVGPRTQTLRIVSDDPDARETALKLSVDVSAGIVLDPAGFLFGTVLVGSSPAPALVVKWKEGAGKAFKVLGVEAPGLDADFETKPFDAPPWHGFAITLRFRNPPRVGPFLANALIHTDSPDAPAMEVHVSGNVSSKVWLSQRFATVGQVPAGKGATIRLTCHGFDKTIDLGTVTVTSRKGVVEAKAVPDPKAPGQWILEIRLPESARAGPVSDVLEVKTGVPGEEVSVIRVGGIVVPAGK